MCGICGIFNYSDPARRVDRALLQRMTRALSHRGPDDEGLHVEGAIGLGHRRLSIVDLSPAGSQPMATADGAFRITYNGEFYNHESFRPRLAGHGVTFRGTSDTETFLYLVSTFGPRVLCDTAAIFAFALWDREARRLMLARDPLGVKPLYYHDDGSRVVFASEVKALLECAEIGRDIDTVALNEYLHFHTPLFERTFFRGIEQVRPGEVIEVDRHGLHRRIYAETGGSDPAQAPAAARVDALRALLGTVVTEQLMSDVPVAAFFSGGIDSTAVAAHARRTGRLAKCFGIHFTDQGVIDERPYQERAAAALGVKLELTTVDHSEFPNDFIRLNHVQDYPVIGAAMIPMYHVSKLAARQVKVCLGGEGGDEIFGGYARYALVHPGRMLASWLSRGRASASSAEQPVGGNLVRQLIDPRNVRRLARRLRPGETWSRRYFENFVQVPEPLWNRVFPDDDVFSRDRARETFEDVIRRSPATDPGDRILDWDVQTYLPGLFQQDDRMSMANSLEVRVPLADPRIVRFARQTAFDLKLREGATKWILRQAVADVVPHDVVTRRKVGFDTPAESWMRGPHRGFVRELLVSSAARSRGYWDPDGVEWILERESSPYWFTMVWKLACIEAWALNFLDHPVVSAPREADEGALQPA